MIFLIGNHTDNFTICFPSLILHDSRLLTFPFSILLFIESLLTLLTAFYVLKTLLLCVKIHAFHKNMAVMMFLCALQWFEAAASNLMIKPYETGYWKLGDVSALNIKQWWTANETMMIRLPNTAELDFFFLGGLLKWHYIFSMVLMLLVISIERVFACYFIHDYEKKSRNGVMLLLIFGYQSLALLATFGFFFNVLHFIFAFIFVATPNVLAIGIFFYTRYFNQKIIRSIDSSASSHTYLPAKFQARENIRSFKMIKKVLISAFFIISFASFVSVLMFLELSPELDVLWNILFKNAINLNPLIICPTLFKSVDTWRNFSVTDCLCGKIARRRSNKVSSISCEAEVKDNEQTKKETDAYFDQLNAAWI